MQPGTSCCTSQCHTKFYNPPFLWNEVPNKFFLQDPNNPNSGVCVHCYFCRLIQRARGKKSWAKLKAAANEQNSLVEKGTGTLMNCPDAIHGGSSGSEHARDAVPVEKFRARCGDPRSRLCETCSDCRNHRAAVAAENDKKRREEATAKGRCLCGTCFKDITDCRILNRDGTVSKLCKECKDYGRMTKRRLKAHYKGIIINRIKQNNVSCMRCEKLYFAPATPESFIVQEFETYVRNGQRYCLINNCEKLASDMIAQYESSLELDIIELDHMTMHEQLERGIINNESEFFPKRNAVSALDNTQDMDHEAVGCQHLCCRCHVIVTIERQTGPQKLSKLGHEKLNHMLFLKYLGCESCDYRNPQLPRFFDMDHVDSKVETISRMVRDDTVSLEQFKEECKKCRVLCRFCHKIRTRLQRKAGIRSLRQKSVAASEV
jgi:hypothetical protein